MKTQTFIERVAQGIESRPRNGRKYVASVLYDGDTVYSYGTHYPLLFKVGSVWVCNDSGYSSSTGRHISYARGVADYCVQLRGGGRFDAPTVKESAQSEIARNENLIAVIEGKKAKRPRYAVTYQTSIDRLNDRNAMLTRLIALCV